MKPQLSNTIEIHPIHLVMILKYSAQLLNRDLIKNVLSMIMQNALFDTCKTSQGTTHSK
jgi:hypothetical protein